MAKTSKPTLALIGALVHSIRGQRVLLDADLAQLYGVTTKRLNEQIRRNLTRFPDDFMFQISPEEADSLRSQIATSKPSVQSESSLKSQFVISRPGRGGRRTAPYAFTEHGAIMAASVLNSPKAVEVSIFVVRAFVQMRQWMANQEQLAEKLADLEKRVDGHDGSIRQLVVALRQLMAPPATIDATPKRPIGFHAPPAKDGAKAKRQARAK